MVKLNVSYNTGRKTLKKERNEFAASYSADEKSIGASFRMFDSSRIKQFTTALSILRNTFKQETLTWGSKGERVIPVKHLIEFSDKIRSLIDDVEVAFNETFIQNYDNLKADAINRAGNLDITFPDKSELQDAFEIKYVVSSMADPQNIILESIDQQTKAEIQASMRKEYANQIESGVKDLARRIVQVVDSINERVVEDDQKGKKYSVILENLKSLTTSARMLNITNSNEIKEVCNTIDTNINCWTSEAIKSSEMVRDIIEESSNKIKDKLNNIVL